MRTRLAQAAAFCVLAGAAHGGTLFVNAGLTTGANDGSTWANAFQGRLGLIGALGSASSGDEIWVATGVYAPAGVNGSRDASFVIPSGVVVLGGFVGGETLAQQRNSSAHVVALTGDLNGNDGPPQNGIAPNTNENSRHVVVFAGVTGATLDGVTVRAGSATGSGDNAARSGGNVQIIGGEATLIGCVLERGYASASGGGAVVINARASFVGCVVRGTRGDSRGSGIAVLDNATALVDDCDFDANFCGTGAGMYLGVLGFNDMTTTRGGATVTRSRFHDGQGIISAPSGGGIFNNGGTLDVRESTFERNVVDGGGGALYLRGGSSRVDRCDFIGNEAPGDGGGAIYVDGDEDPGSVALVTNSRFLGNNGVFAVNFEGNVRVVNCTLVNNGLGVSFLLWPAFFVSSNSAATISNTIVWGNATGGTFGIPDINLIGAGVYTLTNNIIDHWTGAMGPGASGADPLFVDWDGLDNVRGTTDDDLRLLPGSPARDTGSTPALPLDAPLDFTGAARVIDGDGDGLVIVDVGALEARCAGDADGDGLVNFADLNGVLSMFGAGSGSGADMNFDGSVNFADLNAVLSAFGVDCR